MCTRIGRYKLDVCLKRIEMVEERGWSDKDETFKSRIKRNFRDDKDRWEEKIRECEVREDVREELIDVFRTKHSGRKLDFLRCHGVKYNVSRIRKRGFGDIEELVLSDKIKVEVETIAGQNLVRDSERCDSCEFRCTFDEEYWDYDDELGGVKYCTNYWSPLFDVADYYERSGQGLASIITPKDLGAYLLYKSVHDKDFKWCSWGHPNSGVLYGSETWYGNNFAGSLIIDADAENNNGLCEVYLNLRCWLKEQEKIYHNHFTLGHFGLTDILECLTACPNQENDRFSDNRKTLASLCLDKLTRDQLKSVRQCHGPLADLINARARTRDVYHQMRRINWDGKRAYLTVDGRRSVLTKYEKNVRC